jgi:hypothetical protein
VRKNKKTLNLQVGCGFSFYKRNPQVPWREMFIREIILEYSTTSSTSKIPKTLLSAVVKVSDVMTREEILSEHGSLGTILNKLISSLQKRLTKEIPNKSKFLVRKLSQDGKKPSDHQSRELTIKDLIRIPW